MQSVVPSLQAAAERAVGKNRACAVAIDPGSGRVLALVNEEMACKRSFPPGSTLKLLTAFAGLEEGLITPDSTVTCRNLYKSGNDTLICSLPGGHGKVRLEEAIAFSCNVYFYSLGERLGPERLLKCFRAFGLSGPEGLSGRSAIARAAVGQAQGLTVTPMRMAMITAAIANGGKLFSPSSRKTEKITARPGTFSALRRGMRMAVVKGTAKRAAVPGMNVCGKTGSPETESNPDHRHGWFVGFAPYDRPEIVVVVFAEYGHGGVAAAPIARDIFKAYKEMRAH